MKWKKSKCGTHDVHGMTFDSVLKAILFSVRRQIIKN